MWLIRAALGKPVVPLVKMWNAVSVIATLARAPSGNDGSCADGSSCVAKDGTVATSAE